ncbi:MAG: hypothetical protein CVU65_13550 [Deltaproteobacteria bacterium HGW-Deltaproteobacteria-22]|jgi:AcrR family transcriptional regulator|nr:MAG: hypothetical protein CVU65_13550 [Deltaproteobacteria bacterium HGW-Deltaproteobacteria-22]
MTGRPRLILEEQILDAAVLVFREEGHATTTAKIAQRAGVSEGIIFYRFKSKEELLAAVIRRETQPPELILNLAERVGREDIAKTLHQILTEVLASVFRGHPFFEIMETSSLFAGTRKHLLSQTLKPPPQVIVELIAEYLEAEIRLGRIRRVPTLPAARAMFGGCIDYVRSRRFCGPDEGQEAFVQGLVDFFLGGLAPVEED